MTESLNDRARMELAEARVLYSTWVVLKTKVLTLDRIARLEKLYGIGAANRIRSYMDKIKSGEIE